MTRIEAFRALQIDKPELLRTKEIKLANGKIIGHRDLRYIYKQNLRLPDEREAVLINKMSIAYRLMKNKTHGPHDRLALTHEGQKQIASGQAPTYKQAKRIVRNQHLANYAYQKKEMKIGMTHNMTKMTFFRVACNV